MTASSETLPMVVPADHQPGPRPGCWTYDGYAALPDDGRRYEIIDGVLYLMPAPGSAHQGSNIRFSSYLLTYVEFAGLGRVFPAP